VWGREHRRLEESAAARTNPGDLRQILQIALERAPDCIQSSREGLSIREIAAIPDKSESITFFASDSGGMMSHEVRNLYVV
jgi:hypothetical protein